MISVVKLTVWACMLLSMVGGKAADDDQGWFYFFNLCKQGVEEVIPIPPSRPGRGECKRGGQG
jgi:hypothetical protein